MGVCQASPPQQPCEVGCVVLSYKWRTEGSQEEVTCLVIQQGTPEPGLSPSLVSSKAHTFSLRKKQEVVLIIKALKLKVRGLSAPWGVKVAARGEAPRACLLLALGNQAYSR